MKPDNFSRDNFDEWRRASACSAYIRYDPYDPAVDKRRIDSCLKDIWKVNNGNHTFFVFSMNAGFRYLVDSIANMMNKEHKDYKPNFVRAQIYENFDGQQLYTADWDKVLTGCNESKTKGKHEPTLYKLIYKTIKHPTRGGNHTVIDSALSTQFGRVHVPESLMSEHMNFSWDWWMTHSIYAPRKKYKYEDVAREATVEKIITNGFVKESQRAATGNRQKELDKFSLEEIETYLKNKYKSEVNKQLFNP